LKAITSASEDEVHRLTRIWVYGSTSQADGGGFPFLFINGGAATLSGSAFGSAIVKDTITQREIQTLRHTGVYVCCFLRHFLTLMLTAVDRRISAMVRPVLFDGENVLTVPLSAKAHNISNDKYTIATADCGANATVKVWTARRSSHPRGQVSGGFSR